MFMFMLLPSITYADEKIELNIKFTNLIIKGGYDSYSVIMI